MRKIQWLFLIFAIFCTTALVQARPRGNGDYSRTLSARYGVSAVTIERYHRSYGNWSDVSTGLYLAHRSAVSPDVIFRLHRSGMSYAAIAARYNVPPGTYYEPVTRTRIMVAAPAGYVWGSDHHYHRHGWHDPHLMHH